MFEPATGKPLEVLGKQPRGWAKDWMTKRLLEPDLRPPSIPAWMQSGHWTLIRSEGHVQTRKHGGLGRMHVFSSRASEFPGSEPSCAGDSVQCSGPTDGSRLGKASANACHTDPCPTGIFRRLLLWLSRRACDDSTNSARTAVRGLCSNLSSGLIVLKPYSELW